MVTAAMKLKDTCFLERKAMTNVDSILKSRDITLPTVMYGCEVWAIRKAE